MIQNLKEERVLFLCNSELKHSIKNYTEIKNSNKIYSKINLYFVIIKNNHTADIIEEYNQFKLS